MIDLAETEAAKYRTVWSRAEYRRISPGELEKETAFKWFNPQPGETLNDYGSGPARATAWFRDHGLDVLGVDHAENAAETDVPVLHRCLWDMGDVRVSDYAYCCDVMEHIPPQHVKAVLASIAARTRKAAYFRIATRPDVMGPRLIGEPLHLTVQDAAWWVDAVRAAFHGCYVDSHSNGRDCIIMLRWGVPR